MRINDEGRNILESALQRAKLMIGTIAFGCVVMGGLFFYIINQGGPKQPELAAVYPMFIVFMLSAFAASFAVDPFYLNKVIKSRADQQGKLKDLVASTVIKIALCDSCYLIGLIAAFMIGKTELLYLPILLGSIGFVAHFPRREVWERAMNNS